MYRPFSMSLLKLAIFVSFAGAVCCAMSPRSMLVRRVTMNAEVNPNLGSGRRELFRSALSIAASLALFFENRECTAAPMSSFLDDDTVSYMTEGGRKIYIVGTAHISEKSADLVREVIRSTKPDVVMIELDQSRLPALRKTTTTQSDSPVDLLANIDSIEASPDLQKLEEILSKRYPESYTSESKAKALVTPFIATGAGKVISNLYRQLNDKGFESGGEFEAAIETALEVKAKILLGDRPVKQTLRNLSEALWATGIRGFMNASLDDLELDMKIMMKDNDISTKEGLAAVVESMKNRNMVDKETYILNKNFPFLYRAMVAERDAYMGEATAQYMNTHSSNCACMIVGLAHMSGIEKYLGEQYGFQLFKKRTLFLPQQS